MNKTNRYITLVASIIVTIIIYILILYVLPSDRLIQLFWKRGPINVMITYVGIYGLLLVVKRIKYVYSEKYITDITAQKNDNPDSEYYNLLSLHNKSIVSRVVDEYTYLGFISTLCISLGFLGTVFGLSGGVSSLSMAFSNTADMSNVKSNIFGLLSGLGTAFDSTLLGLAFSILISLVISFGEKYEKRKIGRVFEETILNGLSANSITNGSHDKKNILGMNSFPLEEINKYCSSMNEFSNMLSELVDRQNKTIRDIVRGETTDSITSNVQKIAQYAELMAKLLKQYSIQPKKYMITEFHSNEK